MSRMKCELQNCGKFADWITTRGGLALWGSVNLSNLSASWITPFHTVEGELTPKPDYQAGNTPSLLVTDPKEVEVILYDEVKRIRVATRIGSQGFMEKLTDASTARLRAACARVPNSCYKFDYDTKEAVILSPRHIGTLAEYIADPDAFMLRVIERETA